MKKELFSFLVYPIAKGALIYDEKRQELIFRSARLAYSDRDSIPLLLKQEGSNLISEELVNWQGQVNS